MAKLTDKQTLFIEAYLECWNATEAARQAQYKHPRHMGSENLAKPVIRERISQRLQAKAMSADEVLMRLAEQARGDISDFVQDYGAIDWEAVKEKGHLVKKVSHTAGKQSSIELYDAQSALEKIGKAHGLFVDRQVQTGKMIIEVVRGHQGSGTPSGAPSEATGDP